MLINGQNAYKFAEIETRNSLATSELPQAWAFNKSLIHYQKMSKDTSDSKRTAKI